MVSEGSDRLAELESFLGTVPGMIFRTRLEAPYDVEFLTDEAGTVAGYPAGDFVGSEPRRRYHELIEPEDRERLGEAMLGLPADGSVAEIEYRLRRADGSLAWILTRARKVVAPDGTPWVHGASVDVTARHEAAALRARLEAERARAAEIEASRARIVEAADEARRKLERDLHDGAQQHLVVASLTLRRAAAEARATPASALVAEGLALVQDGLAALRDLANGLHPAVLSERGLGPALEGLAARSPVPVDLRVVEERVSPAAEAAIYFTVAEALTNVAKYAEASRVRVAVELQEGALVCEIADDGVGGATPTGGSGLRGLADRLDALGGTLEVRSAAGSGTVISARAPV